MYLQYIQLLSTEINRNRKGKLYNKQYGEAKSTVSILLKPVNFASSYCNVAISSYIMFSSIHPLHIPTYIVIAISEPVVFGT